MRSRPVVYQRPSSLAGRDTRPPCPRGLQSKQIAARKLLKTAEMWFFLSRYREREWWMRRQKRQVGTRVVAFGAAGLRQHIEMRVQIKRSLNRTEIETLVRFEGSESTRRYPGCARSERPIASANDHASCCHGWPKSTDPQTYASSSQGLTLCPTICSRLFGLPLNRSPVFLPISSR